jgi:RNA polymerase sigma-70 factor (ECF subfamily)
MDRELESLAEAAARGERAAVDALLARYLPELRAFVRLRAGALIRAHESSSDLVQSTCREVIQHMDRFRFPSESAFRHWLFTTALRKISNRRDYWTARKRAAPGKGAANPAGGDPTGGDEAVLRAYASFSTPSRHAIAREELERIEAAFEQLSEEHREVIALARVAGLSRAEIAEQMGRSEVAVRALLHRALARLADLLSTDEEPRVGPGS